jgi:6-phosphogluconolactonase
MEVYPNRDDLAGAAAMILAGALAGTGPRLLVVTGGSTPGPVYDRLAGLDLGWSEVAVTLSDERWVDPESPDSNARLVRTRLLVGKAAQARFLPLMGSGETPEADARAAGAILRGALPSAATLLGMGDDGHIASLFPRDPDLASRLDPNGGRLCVGVPVSGLAPFVPRISLTLGAILATRLVVLLITGEKKRAVVEAAGPDQAASLPVAALLNQRRVPVRVLWAP